MKLSEILYSYLCRYDEYKKEGHNCGRYSYVDSPRGFFIKIQAAEMAQEACIKLGVQYGHPAGNAVEFCADPDFIIHMQTILGILQAEEM